VGNNVALALRNDETLVGQVAETELVVLTVESLFLVDHRRDEAVDQREVIAQLRRNDRLDIENPLSAVFGPDVVVEVALERNGDQARDRVL
jgi:hypothetical protein